MIPAFLEMIWECSSPNVKNAVGFIVPRAFAASPAHTCAFLFKEMPWIHVKSKKDFYRLAGHAGARAELVVISLSMILAFGATVEQVKQHFGKNIAQIMMFAVHIYPLSEFRFALFPTLLEAVLHSMKPSDPLTGYSTGSLDKLAVSANCCLIQLKHKFECV